MALLPSRMAWTGLLSGLLLFAGLSPIHSQTTRAVGRDAAKSLRFEELRFDPPQVQTRTLESGVPVLLMEDHSLPLVTLYARFRGGYALVLGTNPLP